jgi:hypothetical protein
MGNQRFTRKMLTNNRGVAPHPQNRRVTRVTPLLRSGFLCLLTICVPVIGFTVRAQDSSNPQQSQASAKQQAPDSREVSGFLGDYSKLAPDPKNGDLLLYEKDSNVLKKYHKFIIDPITIYLLPEAQAQGFKADDMDRLAKYFHDAVTDELKKSGRYEVVTNPGPDVLEVNVAITNVEPTGGKENAALKATTTAVSVATVPGVGMVIPRISVGRASIEGEMVDSVSGEQLVAFMTSKAGGRRWFSGLSAYKKWADIEAAFRSWAENFRERLDDAHGA